MKTQDVISIALASGLYQDDEMFFSPSVGDADVHISDLEYFAKLVEERTLSKQKAGYYQDGYEAGQHDMSTKSQNVDTSAEYVHDSDKSDMAHRSGGLSVEQAENPLDIVDRAYFAGKQAGIAETLAQGEQEPVAAVELITIGSEQVIAVAWYDSNAFKVGTKLYTAPPSNLEKEKESTAQTVDPRLLLGRSNNFTKETGNRLCDIERRLAVIETQQAPPSKPWVSLTDDEIDEAAIKCVKSGQSVNAAIRAIEAALRSKNDTTRLV